MNGRIETLALIRLACWQMLERASHEIEHDWRHLVLATVAGEGADAYGDARLIVLREADSTASTLTFFTDARSPKVTQLRRQPVATMHAWSATLGWQLRMRCTLDIQTDGLAVSSRWARLKMTPGAHDYLSPLAPGATLDSPWSPLAPAHAERASFAVVTAKVDAFDWLELHADGHRRAVFDEIGERWINP